MTDNNKTNQNSRSSQFNDEAEEQDNLNSTMMSIDVSNLNLKDVNTRTEIKIEMPSDEEIIQEQLEQKKSPFEKIFSKLFRKKIDYAPKAKKELPSFLVSLANVWICDPAEAVLKQVYFYLFRLVLLAISVYAHYFLIQHALLGMEEHHPAQVVLMILIIVDVVFVLLSFLFKASPGWVVAWPLSVMAVMLSYFAIFFNTSSPLVFAINNNPVSDYLDFYYLAVLFLMTYICVTEMAQSMVSRLLLGLLGVLCLVPMSLSYFYGVSLETSFYGFAFLKAVPMLYLQPVYLSFHVLIPLLFFVLFFISFLPVVSVEEKMGRGFARSLTLLCLVLLVANFSLMQKNRIFHVFNFLYPQALDVGGVEMELLNQKIRVETKNFHKQAGLDGQARYHFTLNQGQKPDQFLLQATDQFGVPVRDLKKEDLVVSVDGESVKKFKVTEEPDINPERGNYIIEFHLEDKAPLLVWEQNKKEYSPEDQISFKLTDMEQVQRILVKHKEETLLDVVNPKKEDFTLALNYFDSGNYKLDISLFDRLNQEIYSKRLDLVIATKPDFGLLFPVEDDVIEEQVSVLLLPRSLLLADIETVTFKVDGEELDVVEGDLFYHTLDVSFLSEGEHKLEVALVHKSGQIEKTVRFIKETDAPQLVITQPVMGAFSSGDTAVQFELQAAEERKIAGIKTFVNGNEFPDIVVDDNKFVLPVSRWFQTEIYLTLQATLDDGTKVSDWVQVNKGLSILDVQFDMASLDFLNYENVAVILDASISSSDNWQGRDKWSTIKKLVMDPDVDKRSAALNPTYILFGGSKPHYFQDCSDQEILVKGDKYNLNILKRKLAEKKPNGVSAVVSALTEAYKTSPDKIFLFADNKDSCQSSFQDVQKLIKKSPKTQVVVFVLGIISDNSKKWLESLVEKTGGRFYQPENYSLLKKYWLSEMVLSYDLLSGEELVSRDPLGSKKYYLGPGTYAITIPFGLEKKELEFSLENGSQTELMISGEKGNIKVKESKLRL